MSYEGDVEKHKDLCVLTMMDINDVMGVLLRAAQTRNMDVRTAYIGSAAAALAVCQGRIRDKMLPPRG